MITRILLPLAAAALLGGCVYNPYAGTYQPGIVAAPAYGYYEPAYAYPAPVVELGGGWGWHDHGWRGGGGWRR